MQLSKSLSPVEHRCRPESDDGEGGEPRRAAAPVRAGPDQVPAAGVGHIRALDGLRGLAILLVLLRHTSWRMEPTTGASTAIYNLMRTGWVGVDLFFVLSGFLITGILLDAKGGPHYFRNFYVRRSLRIFPLYYAFLAGAFLVLPLLANDAAIATLRESQPWLWTYLTNVLVSIEGPRATPLGMTHLWSLAVEEQFYLVWPAVVLWCSRRRLVAVCAWMAVAAFAVRLLMVGADGQGDYAGYMLTPARMDALGFGALLAVFIRDAAAWERVRRWGGRATAGIAVVLGALVVGHNGLPQFGAGIQTVGYTLIALLSAATLAAVLLAPRGGALRRWFEAGWLRALGKYSYGIYVFHYPLLIVVAGHYGFAEVPELWGSEIPAQLLLTTAVGLVSFGAAWLSWHLYEKHFLKLKRFFPMPAPAAAGAPAAAADARGGTRTPTPFGTSS